jgi:hypothetical protein
MNKRYVLSSFALLAGILAMIGSRVFTGTALEWVSFGLSSVVVVTGAIGLALADRARYIAGYGALALVAALGAVAALVFTGPALGWLVLGDAILVSLVAFAALAIHEVTTERVVHTFEVSHAGEHQLIG